MNATLVALLVYAGAAMAVVGCGRGAARSDEPVQVLATVYAMADIARQVGGDYVNVEWYVESGQSLAELVETPERRNQVRSAELVITRGAPDPWTLEGIGNQYQDRKVLRLDTLPSTRDGDPAQYQWLDPQTAIEVADELATRLSALRPRHEKTFKANAAAFDRKVADMMEQTSGTVNRTIGGGGAFVTLDRGFVPLARRFGLEEAKPRSTSARDLHQIMVEQGAGVLFLNSETPPPSVRDWQNRLHMPVLTLDSLGTSSPTGRSTYLALLKYNLTQLEIAASRARPTTATTRYMAETVDPNERQPPLVPTPPVEEYPNPPSPMPPDSSGIKVSPIPNPYAGILQPSAPTTRRQDARPRVQRPATPTPSAPRSDPSGIRVVPMPPSIPGRFEPTTRRHPTTVPSLDNPFGQ